MFFFFFSWPERSADARPPVPSYRLSLVALVGSSHNLPRYALAGSRLATCLSNCGQSPPEIIATSATASRSASACPIRSSSGCLLSASVPSRSKAIRAFMPIAPRWRLGNRACRARLLGDRLLASEQPPPVFGTDRLYRRRKERPARRSLGGGRQDRQAYDRFPPDVSMQLCR